MAATVVLAAESFAPGNGGIARVARLMAKVLSEEVSCGRVGAQALAFNAALQGRVYDLPAWGARGSRLRFCLRVQREALASRYFLYDFLGMARAHRMVPGLRRPMLCCIHGIEVWENTAPKWLRAARRADILMANTAYTRERADSLHGNFTRARVCWLATETDDPPAATPKPAGPPTVLILGRMDQGMYKGHQELIDCWPTVTSAVPQARLLIVGGGPRVESVKQMAAASPVARQIEFMGFVTDQEIDGVWAQADVFAMPSRGEGFGLVYIEAMRHGVPVIGSVHDAAPEINVEGQTGYNVNLDRQGELANRLIQVLRDPEHAAALGRNGRQRWNESFRYQAFRARFLPILHELLAL